MVSRRVWYQAWACVLTFLSYALLHATRKSFSNVKATLKQDWGNGNSTEAFFGSEGQAERYLGILDGLFMSFYAVGLFFSGTIGDRFPIRFVLGGGMMTAALSVGMFGLAHYFQRLLHPYWFALWWSLNGLLQSTGWPAVVAVMGNWFGRGSRGGVMGVWSANASVGNIIGAFITNAVLDKGWWWCFFLPALLLFGGGLLVVLTLVPHPHDAGLSDEASKEDAAWHAAERESRKRPPKTAVLEEVVAHRSEPGPAVALDSAPESGDPINGQISKPPVGAISVCQAFLIPGVIVYSCAYACLKSVNYALFYWLPLYETNGLKMSDKHANSMSSLYDVGGIAGGAIAGWLSDRAGKRSPVLGAMLFCSIGSLTLLRAYGRDNLTIAVFSILAGIMIGGPANLISSAVAADIGHSGAIAGNVMALATVTGIVDGSASVGAAIVQVLVPAIQTTIKSKHGRAAAWNAVFYLLMALAFMSLVCLLGLIRRDVSWMWHGGLARHRAERQRLAEAAARCKRRRTTSDSGRSQGSQSQDDEHCASSPLLGATRAPQEGWGRGMNALNDSRL